MRRVLYWVLIALFSVIFLVSAFFVGRYVVKSHKYKQQLSDLQQLHTTPDTRPSVSLRQPSTGIESNPTTGTKLPDGFTIPTIPDYSRPDRPDDPDNPNYQGGILPELKELYAMNSDLIGYIYVEDTGINNPVMQRKDIKDYYLHRDFFRSYNEHGCVYVREACDVFEPTDVVTLYGHSMLDGTMFGDLHKFKQESFFNAHPLIYFDTLYERHAYQVVCIFRTSAEYGEGFPFHLFDDFEDEAEFQEFIQGVRGQAIQDSGISVRYGDKFICLSTCEDFPIENGRLVLVAVRVD